MILGNNKKHRTNQTEPMQNVDKADKQYSFQLLGLNATSQLERGDVQLLPCRLSDCPEVETFIGEGGCLNLPSVIYNHHEFVLCLLQSQPMPHKS